MQYAFMSTFSPLVTNMNWWNCFGEQWWKKPFREEKRLFLKWLMCLWVASDGQP